MMSNGIVLDKADATMDRPIRLLLVSLLLTLATAVLAAQPDIPAATSLLVDEVGALTEAQRTALLARLRELQDERRAQIGVLISRDTRGLPLSEYSLRVAEKWELGRSKTDDGLLVLIVTSPAAARLEVGYGLEGYIPDARASQWLDELFPAVKSNDIAAGLDRLLGEIDEALPKAEPKPNDPAVRYLFPDHPEWRVPFVLFVFSFFAIFPLFLGRWGAAASAPALAAFYAPAAWLMWGSTALTAFVGAFAFALPILWSLNGYARELPAWAQRLRTFGNLAGIALFFSIITVFIGAVLYEEAPSFLWGAPTIGAFFAVALGAFLFPGKPAHYLSVVLRSACHFVFILLVAYVSIGPFSARAGEIAFAAAFAVTTFAAIGLYVDSRERLGHRYRKSGARVSQWFFVAALLVALPFTLLAFVLSVGGEDLQTMITQGLAGGGSLAAILGIAARAGLIGAVKVGLGGRFGGGGAERSD